MSDLRDYEVCSARVPRSPRLQQGIKPGFVKKGFPPQASEIGPVREILNSWKDAAGKTVLRVDVEQVAHETVVVVRFSDGAALMLEEGHRDTAFVSAGWPINLTCTHMAAFFGVQTVEQFNSELAEYKSWIAAQQEAKDQRDYQRLKDKFSPS